MLKPVTKDEFYKKLRGEKRDVMPTIVNGEYPYIQEYRSQDLRRELFGKSHDGNYWLEEEWRS